MTDNPAITIRDAGAGDIQTVIRLDEIHTGLAKPDYWRKAAMRPNLPLPYRYCWTMPA